MSNKIAYGIHLFSALFLSFFAITYLTKSSFMPYHALIVGSPWHEITRQTQVLILSLMKGTGSAWLTIALVILVLSWLLLKQQQRVINYLLLVTGLSTWLPILAITLYVNYTTAGNPPWYLFLILSCLSLIAFFLAKPSRY